MTELEWLASDDPVPMLEYLRGKVSERKLRLFEESRWWNGFIRTDKDQAALLRDIAGNPFRQVALHDLYRTGDTDAPDSIKDANGDVALGLCRRCGKGECDLVEPCSWLAWQNGTVPKLAQRIYQDRDFDLMPVLADALEEAGCSDEDILRHCRGNEERLKVCPYCEDYPADYETNVVECRRCDCTGYILDEDSEQLHARGCWVVDLLLGKG